MDSGIIVAIVGSAMALIGVVISMMFWCRQEANQLRSEAREDRKNLIQIGRNLEITVNAMKDKVSDFHDRLLEIERNRNKT